MHVQIYVVYTHVVVTKLYTPGTTVPATFPHAFLSEPFWSQTSEGRVPRHVRAGGRAWLYLLEDDQHGAGCDLPEKALCTSK